ncbi:PKD domain protein [compost metagenome]
MVNFTISEITTTVAAVPTGITCFGMLNGSAVLTVANAAEYSLNGGPHIPIPNPFELTGLAAGPHQVVVFHAEGCTDMVDFIITEINPAVTVAPTDVTCHGMANGSVSLSVTNATEYSLNGGLHIPIPNPFELNGLAAGSYQLDVFHPEGCTGTVNFTITEPPSPTELLITSISPDLSICSAGASSITAEGSGGTSPYIFTWFTETGILGTGTTVHVTTNQTMQYGVILTDACGAIPDTAFMTIEVIQPISPMLTPDDPDGCFPHHVVFSNSTVSNENILTSTIDFGDGTPPITTNALDTCSHIYEVPGTYTVRITSVSMNGCEYSNTFTDKIVVYDNPTPGFTISPVPATLFETNVTLTNTSSDDIVSYSWVIEDGTPATSSSENVNVDFPKGIVANYQATLIVTDINGCVDSVTEIVRVLSDVILYAPNTFTPDGDELNQLWSVHIDGIDFYQFDLHVFDRWGELIWESHDPKGAWDGTYCGKIVPYGTYTWILTTREFLSDKKHTFNGHINLIR